MNLVPAIAVGRMHDERLQDAALSDVLRELGDRLEAELGEAVAQVGLGFGGERGELLPDGELGGVGHVRSLWMFEFRMLASSAFNVAAVERDGPGCRGTGFAGPQASPPGG